MAIFKSTVFSRLRKSFGNATTCFSRGQNILKEKVTMIRNPRTPKQLSQRGKMKVLVELSRIFGGVLKLGFPERPVTETAYNSFIRKNMQAVEISDELECTVNYEKLICSDGTIADAKVAVTTDASKHQLTFTHQVAGFGALTQPTDRIYAVVLAKNEKKLELADLGMRNAKEPVVVTLTEISDTEGLAVYAFVVSENGQKASATQYVTISES